MAMFCQKSNSILALYNSFDKKVKVELATELSWRFKISLPRSDIMLTGAAGAAPAPLWAKKTQENEHKRDAAIYKRQKKKTGDCYTRIILE